MEKSKRYTLRKNTLRLVKVWAKREGIEEMEVIVRAMVIYDLVLKGCITYQSPNLVPEAQKSGTNEPAN